MYRRRCAQMPDGKDVEMTKRSIALKKKRGNRRFDPAVFLETAAKGRVISTHPKKQIIFAQGDAADAVFYIRKGKVKVTVVSTQGKEAVVAILGLDEFVGEGCLIGQPKRLATASAMTDCEAAPSRSTQRSARKPSPR